MSDLIDRQAVLDWLNDEWDGMVLSVFDGIRALPSVQPEPHYDEWCTDCKEYDTDKHCCPRWNRVIRQTLKDAQPEQQWIPCSEHPDTDRNVFIARGKTDFLSCCIGHYDHNAKLWYEDRNWFAKIMYDAMYWCEMPSLPEPWRGEEHEHNN